MASGDLCVVSDVKRFLGVTKTITSDDPLIQQLVSSVSRTFATIINRDILSKDYVEVRDGMGSGTLVLSNYPVTAVASVQIGPPNARTALVLNTGYIFTPWSIKLLGGFRFPSGAATAQVSYTAGLTTVPADLAEKAAKTAALRYKQLSRLGQSSKSLGGESIAFDESDLPADVANLLENYKKRIQVPA